MNGDKRRGDETQLLPVVEPRIRRTADVLIAKWQAALFEAIIKTNDCIGRWERRSAETRILTSKMNDGQRRDWISKDQETNDALAAYGFWQREVMRLSAQIQTAIAVNDMVRRPIPPREWPIPNQMGT